MDKGAHFYNCDFQVHTPRDRSWSWVGNESLENNGCVSDNDRQAYARSLIAACRKKNLDGIAITDHHDMAFFKYVKEAANDERDHDGNLIPSEKQIIVFPGMEVTINPCQLLLIFDADFHEDHFESIYTLLNITPTDASDPKTVETDRLTINDVNTLKAKLDENNTLRDKFIILPNLSTDSSHGLLKNTSKNHVKEMHCIGGYLDGVFDNLSIGNKTIIEGKDPAYGNRTLAYFQTSDNRIADHSKLGEHTSWVKWSEPTAEALRQACLAKESRIFDTEPTLPQVLIKSVAVSNSEFLGSVNLELNKQYNAFIGGRGTGKSTILEYIRWCLCDHKNDDLIENTLKSDDASVTVEFIVDRTPHFITRNAATSETSLRIDAGEETSINQDNVRRMFPIQAYSQKEISDLSQDPEALKRFVETPIREQLDEIDQTLKDLKPKLKKAYEEKLNLRNIEQKIKAGQSDIASSRARIEKLTSELRNISDDDLKLIEQKDGYDQADLYLKNLVSVTNQILERFAQSITWMQSVLQPPETEAISDLNLEDNFFEDVYAALNTSIEASAINISNAIEAIKNTLDELKKNKISAFERSHKEYKSKYDEVYNRLTEHQRRLERIKELNLTIQKVKETLIDLNYKKEKAEKIATEYETLRKSWKDNIIRRDYLLKRQCAELSRQSQNYITATLSKESSVKNFGKSLFKILDGSHIRKERIESIEMLINNDKDTDTLTENIFSELELLAYNKFEAEYDFESIVPNLLNADFESKHLATMSQHLTPETWLNLSLEPLIGQPSFKYNLSHKSNISFSNASAGQQATAIVEALLHQSGPPLIIDQPEDDLDNAIIEKIVEHLWQAKQKRQLIFASHNPNLVVNGDAELVICFGNETEGDQSKGCIQAEGAIDIQQIREKIQTVMEGGEQAFSLRRQKYGF